jgi:hypothetical protein
MLKQWYDADRVQMTGIVGGRVFKLDMWTERGRLQIATGGGALRGRRVGDTLDVVLLGDSCKQRYSTVCVTGVVRRIDCDDENVGTTAVVVEPNGRRTAVPLRADRVFSLEPVRWTFDEMVGTTVRDPIVRRGHFNIQLRRRYDAHGFVGREHIVFPCKPGVRRDEVFTHACTHFVSPLRKA